MFDPSKLSEINIAGLPLSALLGALLTFLICVIVINVIMKLVGKTLSGAKRLNHTMQRFLTSLVRALLWIIAIVIIAGELGIPTASLVALLSVAGLALSLSVQGVLGNIFAGLTLLMTHPFAEGNFVEIAGKTGTVKSVSLLYTTIDTLDNVEISIPNSDVIGSSVTNYSAEPMRRVDMTFSASYDAMSARQAILQDPLIIRTDEDVPADASISDQTFIFDIDGDGKEEEVQNLAAGCGFLAIDQNNNGRIDNGTELFGARSGNGFADLAEYDSDGNGWIDEADDVWSKLCIYTVDSDGAEHMQSLKDADVGAIYLGSAPTEFTKTGDDGISVYGKMRRSGFFLHESTGSAGAMQQVDLGVRNPKFKDYNSIPTTIEESLDMEAEAV